MRITPGPIAGAFLIGVLAPAALAGDGRPGGPLTPEQERATFRLADPALTIELVAAEPEVISPVAIAWDEDGRLYAAEMIDYPSGPEAGRIRLLEDRDGDGHYEASSVFAEGLPFPSGVLPWNGGLIVTAAPDLWYLRDADGDGRADERRRLLTGFGEGNPQLRVNSPTWGIDGWIYLANGRSGGDVRRPEDPPSAAVSLRSNDARFDPQTGRVEAVSGMSQFGLARDDLGDRFPSWNTEPLRHVVMESRVLERNPFLAGPAAVASILDPSDGGRLFAISPPPETFNRESTATFNASCGPVIVRGGGLGPEYRGNALVCESLTNLVHRCVLEPAGTTYVARRAEEGREFLASTDPAFRPVSLANGPDGALYVVDFYREMVEHPQFVTPELRDSIEFRRWHERGRIWRIRRTDSPRGDPGAPRLSRAATAELVALLGHPDGWWRDTAQRLLVERRDPAAAPALAEAAVGAAEPLARAYALWTLEALGARDDGVVAGALADADPRVREAAARIAAGRPGLVPALAPLVDDPAPRVRFHAAIALGNADAGDDVASEALSRFATRAPGDEWGQLALLSGLRDRALPVLFALLRDDREAGSGEGLRARARLLERIAAVIGASRDPADIGAVVAELAGRGEPSREGGRIAVLAGLAEGMARAGDDPRASLPPPPGGDRAAGLAPLLERCEEVAPSAEDAPDDRIRALRCLVYYRPETSGDLVPDLLLPSEPEPLRVAAAQALVEVGSPALLAEVLDRWGTLATGTRRGVLAACLARPDLVPSLIDALEAGLLAPSELDPATREGLLRAGDEALRRRAGALLAAATPAPRDEALRANRAALDLAGEPGRGRAVFAEHCATCHRRGDLGERVGPDLTGVSGRPPSALLADILDPNRDLSADYVAYALATRDGRLFSGLLADETASGVTLRLAGGLEESVLRPEIESLAPSGRSLMPEGMEAVLSPQALADLLAFLKGP